MTEAQYQRATTLRDNIKECQWWIDMLNGEKVQVVDKRKLVKVEPKYFSIISYTSLSFIRTFPEYMKKELAKCFEQKKLQFQKR